MSLRFRSGKMTCLSPARCAAITFSRMPPTGRTCPRRETSPVMAVSERQRRPEKSETSAEQIATPAEGPSLGIPPVGKCRCTSVALSKSWPAEETRPSSKACARSQERAAVADSLITSPRLPVSTSLPEPGERDDSMKSRSPPTCVYARPIETPGVRRRSAASGSYFSGPRICLARSALSTTAARSGRGGGGAIATASTSVSAVAQPSSPVPSPAAAAAPAVRAGRRADLAERPRAARVPAGCSTEETCKGDSSSSSASSSATSAATARQMAASVLSSSRTPASIVYLVASSSSV
mmetsp:Transcript_1661/g.4155  ORF Transcript_1661/g.4155 Transcript_1661/m.4155 type:complete len:295 (-) Transcript_1661:2533-3417(-)